jgi:PIN domain nuclease of toxin-antitoxin system
MRLLIDTCVFLWETSNPKQLSPRVLDILCDAENQVFVSVATIWEIGIKVGLTRLELPPDPKTYISDLLQRYSLNLLPIGLSHALEVGALPHFHRDPFDRMIIAQAQVEGLPVATADHAFRHYKVDICW